MANPEEIPSAVQKKHKGLTPRELLEVIHLDTAMQVLAASEGESGSVRRFKFPVEKHQRSFISNLKDKDVLLPGGLTVRLNLDGENVVVTVVAANEPKTLDLLLKAQVESWIREKTRQYDR